MPEIADFSATAGDDAPAARSRACEYCGSPLDGLDRFCPACGGRQADVAEAAASADEGPRRDGQRRFQCKNCGAEVEVDPEERSYICAFCESTYVVELDAEADGRQPPEFVIPFAVTMEEAREKFEKWLAAGGWFRPGEWFRPGDMHNVKIEERLRGVYLPFWSFSMLAESEWSASIGEHWQRTETYTTRENGKTVTKTRTVTETEWWPLSGRHHRYYSGYLVAAGRGLCQRDAERIKPFHLAALKRYRPEFLAGWQAEQYVFGREEALDACRKEFERREAQNVAAHLPGDTHSGLEADTVFSRVGSDLILLPIFLLSYRHKGRLFRFLLNGQTGRMAGDKPLSPWKVGAAVGAVVLLLLLAVVLLAGKF